MNRNTHPIASPLNQTSGAFHRGTFTAAGKLTWLALIAVGCAASALAQDQKWTFLVFGDSRGTGTYDPINTTILSELARATTNLSPRPAFVLVPGDLVYAGRLSFFQGWTNLMAPVYQAGIGVYPVLGNHDASDVTSYKAVFGPDLPDNGPPGETNRTYALGYSNVLVLALDEYVSAHRVNQSWVNAVLATNTRPHVFAMGHEPAFKVNHTDCLDDFPANRNAFWNSLRGAGCRLYFAGHDHFYDHTRLDDQDGNPANDLHQMIVGTAGAPLSADDLYNGNNGPWKPVRIRHEARYGFVLVEIAGFKVTTTWYHRLAANQYAASEDVFSWVVNQPPVADASATQPVVISPNATDAQVILNGTRSSDPDGDPLQYLWLSTLNHQPSTILASGVVAVVVLPVGAHPLELVVNDGRLSATNPITVEVITTSQAVARLMALVDSSWPRSQPLLASLSAALASLDRSNPISAINQLLAFQNKVRAQLSPSDSALAASFVRRAQEIIDASGGSKTNPSGRLHGRFTSVAHQPGGRVQLQFSAPPGAFHILEASTNLVDWEMIGVAVHNGDGAFEFEDRSAAKFPMRFYRIVSP